MRATPRLRSALHFTDCKSYITAQEGRKELDDTLQGDLVRACRALAVTLPTPATSSHFTGTWLNKLLNEVDKTAKPAAETSPVEIVWVQPLQQPRDCFSHAGIQVHQALPPALWAMTVAHHQAARGGWDYLG